MLPLILRGDLLLRGNPRTAAQSSGCCGGAPRLWQPCGLVDPGARPFPLPVVVVSGLMSGPDVVEEADVVRSYLISEGYVGAVAATGTYSFGVELYEKFPAVCSLWARDAVPVLITEKLSESFYHPETWVHVRISLLLQFSLLFLT